MLGFAGAHPNLRRWLLILLFFFALRVPFALRRQWAAMPAGAAPIVTTLMIAPIPPSAQGRGDVRCVEAHLTWPSAEAMDGVGRSLLAELEA